MAEVERWNKQHQCFHIYIFPSVPDLPYCCWQSFLIPWLLHPPLFRFLIKRTSLASLASCIIYIPHLSDMSADFSSLYPEAWMAPPAESSACCLDSCGEFPRHTYSCVTVHTIMFSFQVLLTAIVNSTEVEENHYFPKLNHLIWFTLLCLFICIQNMWSIKTRTQIFNWLIRMKNSSRYKNVIYIMAPLYRNGNLTKLSTRVKYE